MISYCFAMSIPDLCNFPLSKNDLHISENALEAILAVLFHTWCVICNSISYIQWSFTIKTTLKLVTGPIYDSK